MTTIAYCNGMIATDGYITAGQTIVDDQREKMIERDGVRFFLSGATSDWQLFVDTYFGDRITPRAVDCAALVVREGSVSCVGVDPDNAMWECPVPSDRCYAIGSGSDHALTAMDMGANAFRAVEMAARRCVSTGGKIRVYEVNPEGRKA